MDQDLIKVYTALTFFFTILTPGRFTILTLPLMGMFVSMYEDLPQFKHFLFKSLAVNRFPKIRLLQKVNVKIIEKTAKNEQIAKKNLHVSHQNSMIFFDIAYYITLYELEVPKILRFWSIFGVE